MASSCTKATTESSSSAIGGMVGRIGASLSNSLKYSSMSTLEVRQAELDVEPPLPRGEFLALEPAREVADHVVVNPELVGAGVPDRSLRQHQPESRPGLRVWLILLLGAGSQGGFGRDLDLVAVPPGRERCSPPLRRRADDRSGRGIPCTSPPRRSSGRRPAARSGR